MPFLLCGHIDKGTEWAVGLDQGTFTIGYSEAATVPVPDPSLASREVEIRLEGDRHVLRDLAEKGRVFLGGAPAREGVLKNGDRIQVGRISILFYEQTGPARGQIDLYRNELPEDPFAGHARLFEGCERGLPSVKEPARPRLSPEARFLLLGAAFLAGFTLGLLAAAS